MKKMVMAFVIALCLVGAASTAPAQFWPSYSYSYHFYPVGGSYNVSNGYEFLSWHQHANYGSASVSYNYSGPYGSWYLHQNPSPVYYYPVYPSYQYRYHNAYWWYYYRR